MADPGVAAWRAGIECDKITIEMKYVSIFFTILFIWIAVIFMSFTRSDTNEIFALYLAVMGSTVVLFLIGFGRK